MGWVKVAQLASREQAEELAFTLGAVDIETIVVLTDPDRAGDAPSYSLFAADRQAESARRIVEEELGGESQRGAAPSARPSAAPRGGLAFTLGLMLLLAAVLVLEELAGGSQRRDVLIRFGASFGPGVLEAGQWWRTVTAAFLHLGPQHLLANLVALFALGALSRDRFGPGRLAFTWLGSAVAGNWVSLLLSSGPMLRAGASGGVFGLFGALAGARLHQLGARLPRSRFKHWHVLAALLAFLALTAGAGPVDHPAHLGGLLAGALLGLLLPSPERMGPRRDLGLELGLGLLAGCLALAAGLLAWLGKSS